jgi:signal transduction histidine kinase
MSDDAAQARCATVLVVDDQAFNLVVAQAALMSTYRVLTASTGTEALEIVASDEPPDLVLLDISMPEMDGFEVLERLRALPSTREIPVIFLTAHQDAEREQRGFELGAVDFIHKPFRPVVALSRIRAQLEARAARDLLRSNNRQLAGEVESGVHALEQAQLRLVHAEKLAAMGHLAAGIAHEVRNPVSFIDLNLQCLTTYAADLCALVDAYERVLGADPGSLDDARALRRSIDYEFVREDLGTLLADSKEGAARVKNIVRNLGDFSRVGDVDWTEVNLHERLDATLSLARMELRGRCTIEKRYGALPLVRCLPSQLDQVFLNLLVNASQAVEANGNLVISTRRAGDLAVEVAIADDGVGMPAEVAARAFEPFFTTKPVGQGTGLGLSISAGIVAKHGGTIRVESEPGRGTTFTVTLPIGHAVA